MASSQSGKPFLTNPSSLRPPKHRRFEIDPFALAFPFCRYLATDLPEVSSYGHRHLSLVGGALKRGPMPGSDCKRSPARYPWNTKPREADQQGDGSAVDGDTRLEQDWADEERNSGPRGLKIARRWRRRFVSLRSRLSVSSLGRECTGLSRGNRI